ncbi:mannosidase [Vararia minispora EC-137]|uniref:Mannosidase n=1 Tax=Vararia minispora EC-137 TaxID=1314806 RepID=A0ACB8QU23_9AGAM|nr:mannosidase [Vararia minispora EC-137]
MVLTHLQNLTGVDILAVFKRTHAYDVFANRGLLVRYVLLPTSLLLLLWTILRSSTNGIPTRSRLFGPGTNQHVIYQDTPPLYPARRPASWKAAAEEVKDTFLHAWNAYERIAVPHDELRPVSRDHTDNFNGWGVTIHDSLDTMLLMNLTDTFERAVEQVEKQDFWLHPNKRAPFFETTIRHIGGLLSAYALSGKPVLLEKADLLARKLSPVFETESGLPQFSVNPTTGNVSDRKTVCLAEISSYQPEYTYLSKATGNPIHFKNADRVWRILQKADVSGLGGMLPTDWSLEKGAPNDDKLTIGAQGDSAHEYTLKQYILTGKTDKRLVEMYLRMTTQMITRMLWITPKRRILYPGASIGIYPDDHRDRTFEHLACFLPGLFILGVEALPLDDLGSIGIDFNSLSSDLNAEGKAAYQKLSNYKLSDLHRWAAEGMGEACAVMYADQPTGLAPDEATMSSRSTRWFDELEQWREDGRKGSPPGIEKIKPTRQKPDGLKVAYESREYVIKRKGYELRPETIESMFLLWRVTGQIRWRVHGWNMFRAIINSAKMQEGFASVFDVGVWPPSHTDSMPRTFFTLSLKYLYLMFNDDLLVPLDRWVFNTEAHPMPVFTWTEDEQAQLGIS